MSPCEGLRYVSTMGKLASPCSSGTALSNITTPQAVEMNRHINMPLPETPPSLLDNLSDSLVNAFTKVRKPDERFLEMKDGIEKFEEGMSNVERLLAKERTRTEGECDDRIAVQPGLRH
jgi:hypothetical protein